MAKAAEIRARSRRRIFARRSPGAANRGVLGAERTSELKGTHLRIEHYRTLLKRG
ncbi:hypothetical protein [Sciscionella marina]|uniref:hypothetical protein n=1 Tax=Sciscionella marina TaxID=508770 RepID=UPI00037EE0AB|nr:hypothetical protein [Sciscionella marina]